MFSGEPLFKSLVDPDEGVNYLCTEWSGVYSDERMAEEKCKGRVFSSWKEARDFLFSFIDWNTILIGHGLDNDLDKLHVVHARVVDISPILVHRMSRCVMRVFSTKI